MPTPEEQRALDAVAAIEADATKTLEALSQAKADAAQAKTDADTARANLQAVTDELTAANVLTAEQAATLTEQAATLEVVNQRLTAVDQSIDAAVPDDNINVEPSEPTPTEDLPPADGG